MAIPVSGAERARRFRAAHPGYDQRPRARAPKPKPDRPRQICVGIDGETVGDRYVLLAAASEDGTFKRWIEDPAGLPPGRCLQFIAEIPKQFLCWGFVFSYDANMILRPALQVRPDLARRLWDTTYCCLSQWQISWINRKMFKAAGPDGGHQVWDMFPWVQTGFARWLENWDLADETTIARIRDMKDRRPDFSLESLDRIRAYCLTECEYLARGAARLVEMVEADGTRLTSWYSPASLAKADMKQRGISAPDDEAMERIAARAYYGGRSETSQVGPVAGPIYYADIHSAYASAMVDLPCLDHGRWVHETGFFISEIPAYSLVKLRWHANRRHPTWGPFPVRPRTGSLRYPTSGSGWYWGVEVIAAMRRGRFDFTIEDQYRWEPECDHRPFAYLADVYAQRQAQKAAGDPIEYVSKTRLNSGYGVLAEHDHRDRKARYRAYRWSGYITAVTRAKLTDALTDDTLMMATDGMMSRAPIAVETGPALGQWDTEVYDEAFMAGQGIYWLRRGDDWIVEHSRGFELGRLSREQCLDMWETQGRTAAVSLTLRRHIGLGTALHRRVGLLRLWGTFQDIPVVKTFEQEPRRRWVTADPHDGRTRAPSLADHKNLDRADQQMRAQLAAEVAAWEMSGRKGPPPFDAIVELDGGDIDRTFADLDQPAWLVPE